MNIALAALLVIGLVALQVVLVFSGMRTVSRVAFERARDSLLEDVGDAGIGWLGPAQCLGHDLASPGQVRGTGALALSASELRFVLAAPRTRFTIPRDEVTGTEIGAELRRPGFYGRGWRVRLVTVHWRHDGVDAVVGFRVHDADGLAAALGAPA